MKKLFLFFALPLLLASCQKNKAVVQKEIVLADFSTLEFNSYFEVHLIQGSENKMTLEGTAKRIDALVWEIKDEVLSFKSKGKLSWTNPEKGNLKLYITVKNLKLIKANQTCNIESLNALTGDELGIVFADKLNNAKLDLNYNTVFYWNNFPCGGKLELNGSCTNLKIWNFALMQVDALDLIAQNVLVENSSKGDCKVNAMNQIEYHLFGEGNIYLRDNAATVSSVSSISGKGQLIRI